MENKHLIEVACDAYCKCCDTKECENLGEYNDSVEELKNQKRNNNGKRIKNHTSDRVRD